MSKFLNLACPAKLNLFLEILGRRPDGYHELVTVMTPINLCDRLRVAPARRFSLAVEGARLEGTNAVEKTYRAVARRRRVPGARVHLTKRIPAGSGLGGGSSDAAAMIEAMSTLFGLGLTFEEKLEVAAEVGSDVGFFLAHGPALCTGRGEQVHPLAGRRRIDAVLVCPPFANPTAEVYRKFSTLKNSLTGKRHDVTEFLNVYAGGECSLLGKALYNRLETAAAAVHPALNRWRIRHRDLGCSGLRVTGSGSGLYALCASPSQSRRLAARVGGFAVSSL